MTLKQQTIKITAKISPTYNPEPARANCNDREYVLVEPTTPGTNHKLF